MTTKTIYVHRAVPLLILGFSMLMGLLGVATYLWSSESGFGLSMIISAGLISLIALPFFWVRVAVFKETSVQLGQYCLAYRDVLQVTGHIETAQNPSASVFARRARVQDVLFVQKIGEDQPTRILIGVSSQGPEAIAEMIMERAKQVQATGT